MFAAAVAHGAGGTACPIAVLSCPAAAQGGFGAGSDNVCDSLQASEPCAIVSQSWERNILAIACISRP